MDLDLHYYGTYCLARAAGLNQHAAQTIAYAAQYVDDSVARKFTGDEKGSAFIEVATAHHGTDFFHNLNKEDQRHVWVPFHFIPGDDGDTVEERLVCRKDSVIAREMVSNNVNQMEKPYYLELLGITAHVYADTFAHYGFSGIGSEQNEVKSQTIHLENYVKDKNTKPHGVSRIKGRNLHRAIISSIREYVSGGLGHGAVSGYPDQPYLKWLFEYEHKNEKSIRNNYETFMEGSEKLHKMFCLVAQQSPNFCDSNSKDFNSLRITLETLLSYGDTLSNRIEMWKDAALARRFSDETEEIPIYDPKLWENQKSIFYIEDSTSEILKTNIYRFAQAASYHRYYVLRDLLPKHGLVVI